MSESKYLQSLFLASHETGYSNTGDDAAIIPASTIISTDQFIEGTHFLWSHMSAEELGYKSIVQALSDLAAMAAQPTAVLSSLAWAKTHTPSIPSFINGMKQACMDYRVPLVGGDISSTSSLFYADIVVLGNAPSPILKSGARVNDLLVTTGHLGSARAGLLCIEKNLHFPNLIAAYKKPFAHIKTAIELASRDLVTSLTDISDSLSKSAYALSGASQLGLVIDPDKIPIDSRLSQFAEIAGISIDDLKLFSGEDYQLLMTLRPEVSPQVLLDHGLTTIGLVTESGQVRLKTAGTEEPLTEVGWDPFAL
jgi:thiamine-monophosphate kinase